MPKLSLITPVHLWSDGRVRQFLRTIESVKDQSFKDFEWIVVDDGSTVPFMWQKITDAVPNSVLIKKNHEERVIAYNAAFKEAKGDWFVLLDSDDELIPSSLAKLSKAIDKHPEEKMFNYGCMYQHSDGGISYRDPFTPEREKVGHVKFGGGLIVNGTFIWHKSVYEELGAFPDAHLNGIDCSELNYPDKDGNMIRDLYMGNPWDFSAAAQLFFPEIREFFMVDHEAEPNKIIKELGNPWGQDMFLFYKYTRFFHSRALKEYLLIVHPR